MRLKKGKSTPRSHGESAGAASYPGSHPGTCALGHPRAALRPLPRGCSAAASRSPSTFPHGVGHKRSAQNGRAAAPLPSSPAARALRPGASEARAGHRRVRAARTRGAGGLEAFVCRSSGRDPGAASGVGSARACVGTEEAAAQAGQARGPGGAARARAAAGCRLTSPGTAPSTPSRYSGRVRAAAGRCWRRG